MSSHFERGLTLQEAINILTGDSDGTLAVDSIYIAPPDSAALTDEDSADEDNGGLIENLSGKQLLANAEIRLIDNTTITTTPADSDEPNLMLDMEDDVANKIPESDSDANIPTPDTDEYNRNNDVVLTIPSQTPDIMAPLPDNRYLSKSEIINNLKADLQKETEMRKRKQKVKYKWVKGDLEPRNRNFPNGDYSKYKDLSAAELFDLFFDDIIFDIFEKETQKYAIYKNHPNPNITKNNIKCFFAILLLSGYNRLPGKRFYWDSQEDMQQRFVSNAMRRNKFEQIMQFLHCADNNFVHEKDKMWKLRPIIDVLKRNIKDHFVPVENLSYDESMVEYFGRHGCKQFIRGKPVRFGFKIWSLNTPSGYLIDFDIYQGKSLNIPTIYEKLFGKAASPLVKMIDDLPPEKADLPYTFHFDNLFTGFRLLEYLGALGYSAIGTLREDRTPESCPLLSKKEMKNVQRGYHDYALCIDKGILVCKWVDNGVVSIASNYAGVEPIKSTKRYSQAEKKMIQVSRPAVFERYNMHMGGTDRMDQNISQYRISIRSKKWYWPILSWLIDMAVQNAWLLRKFSGNLQPQLAFRRELVTTYILRYGEPGKGPGRPISSKRSISGSRISDDIRYDGINHLVISTPEKKKRRCVGEGCASIMRTMCKKCNVGLCIECFEIFHTLTH